MADPESLIPRACGAIDASKIRAMPLAPVDGFILSRIDGTSTVGDLAEAMAMSVDDVMGSLLKLESLGLVELPTGPKSSKSPRSRVEPKPRSSPPRTPRTPEPASRITTSYRSAPPAGLRNSAPPPRRNSPPPPKTAAPHPPPRVSVVPPATSSASRPPTAGPRAATDPLTDIELPLDQQERTRTLFGQLPSLDHYGVLGVARTADKKAVKRAYFELTAKFHPDRFFRKRLGPFKMQMEAIFHRMTEAHETLTDAAKREAYDAYIGSVEHTRTIESLLAETTAEMRRAEEAVAFQAGAHASGPPPASSMSGGPPGAQGVPPIPRAPASAAFSDFPNEAPTAVSPRSSAPELRTIVDDTVGRDRPSGPRISVVAGANTRRDVLARRLTGLRNSNPPRESSPPGAPVSTRADDAVDSLRRRYQEKVAAARTSQARKYADSGLEALAKGNVVAAANALRVALTFDNENTELKVAYDRAQRASDQLLGDQYLKQADYEEKAEKWAEAARSWRRVARAREDDAKAHERAAHCLVKADGNLHDASALAQRAVQLSPKDARIRLTLANVYLAAGLALNAKRELETAAQLAPNDTAIASLLKRIGKSD